jgi:hypothetical protein
MSIEVEAVDDASRWNELLETAESPTGFHHAAALSVFERQSGADCHRLVGLKGEEPVGLFPVFTLRKGPAVVAVSPPPNLKLPYLGPLVCNRHAPKRRRRDKQNRQFVDACLEWLDAEHDPGFTFVRTPPGYDDVRPFVWQEYDATPRYTYVVDIDRPADDLLSAFSTDARRNVTAEYDQAYELRDGGHDAIDDIIEQVTRRHADQGESFPLSAETVHELYSELPDGVVRPYVCHVDGAFAGGSINVEYGDRSICWVGSAKGSVDLPVNDLLDWRYITDAMDRGVGRYDLAGANNPRIARFKAKFAPELVPYYRLEEGGRVLSTLANLYGQVRG